MDIHYYLSPILLVLLIVTAVNNFSIDETEEMIFIGASGVIVFFTLIFIAVITLYISTIYNTNVRFSDKEIDRLGVLFIQYLFTFIHSLLLLIKNCKSVS